ncbi:hypothetical protein ES702_04273 [subsurface metagenome]
MAEALITPRLVKWARDRYHLTDDIVANKISVDVNRFRAWERGEERPTLRQAQTLAQKLNVPFGYLFLSVPPLEELPLPDLRTMSGVPPRTPSPELFDLLNDMLRKQQWYREYQKSEGEQPIPFVGRFTSDDTPEKIATDITDTLDINDDMRQESPNWELFLREFICRAEDAGVLVMRSGIVGNNPYRKLNVYEFRGFAISDDLAPIVFVNGNDWKAAQIFTLAHEFAHLWIGESGISNLDYMKRSFEQDNDIDRFCDQVAAEVLVPSTHFLLKWNDNNTTEDNLEELARLYKVSEFVVLRRAYEKDKLSFDEYQAHYQRLQARQRSKGTKGGGDFYVNLLARNSSTLTRSLLVAVAEGRMPYRDAARLLNVKIKTLSDIQSLLRKAFANA